MSNSCTLAPFVGLGVEVVACGAVTGLGFLALSGAGLLLLLLAAGGLALLDQRTVAPAALAKAPNGTPATHLGQLEAQDGERREAEVPG